MPKTLVWDGEGAVGRWRARQPELTLDCQGFRGVLGVKVYICKPADPEAKGMLERFHDYLERSFLPGRSFTSPQDLNIQLAGFLVRANARKMRVLGCRPGDRVAADREAMLPLPPVAPEVGWRFIRKAVDDRVDLLIRTLWVPVVSFPTRVERRGLSDRLLPVVRGRPR